MKVAQDPAPSAVFDDILEAWDDMDTGGGLSPSMAYVVASGGIPKCPILTHVIPRERPGYGPATTRMTAMRDLAMQGQAPRGNKMGIGRR